MKKILAFALALAMILTCSLALADRLDDIKAAGKLTVATSPDWPPYEYIDDDGNILEEGRAVERVVLAGQTTEQCILYSALDAYIRHFEVAIPRDGVAHIHEHLADAAFEMMELNMDADISDADEIELS